MARVGRILGIVFSLLVAWVLLRVFVPAGYVTVIFGTLLVIMLVGLAVRSLNFPPRLTRWLIGGTLLLLFVNLLLFPFLNRRFGWVAESLEERSLWASFRVSDVINPKKNLGLHTALYATEKAEIKSREEVLVATLDELQGKLRRDKLLSDADRTELLNVRRQLAKLDEERERIRLSLRESPAVNSGVTSQERGVASSSWGPPKEVKPYTVGTKWIEVGIKPRPINISPLGSEDELILRFGGKEYRKKGGGGEWTPRFPTSTFFRQCQLKSGTGGPVQVEISYW